MNLNLHKERPRHTLEPISAAVSEKPKICDGLIQFYMSDHGDSDMRWLEVEYFAAHVLNKPRVRIVDISRKAKMLPTIDKDQVSISVDNPGPEEMRRKIRSALSQLLEKIRCVEIGR
ncbi:MAG: hypothetical protein ACREWG_06655 [Gammaproteobacteria bacterium]